MTKSSNQGLSHLALIGSNLFEAKYSHIFQLEYLQKSNRVVKINFCMEKPMRYLHNTSKMLHLSLAKEQSFSWLPENGFKFEYKGFSNFDA